MKRALATVVGLLVIAAALAWQYKTALLLALVDWQSDRQYAARQPFYQVPWQHGPESSDKQPGERAPNIILIVADDLGYNDISTFGGGVAGGKIKTPNIDRLAAQGAIFEQSYSGANTCAPSRAMLMTGRYPSRTGFAFTPTPDSMGRLVTMISSEMDDSYPPGTYDAELAATKPPYEAQGLPSAEVTVAEALRDAGYYTAHIGKWHLGRLHGMAPNDQGFDDSLLMQSGLYLPEDSPEVINAKLDFDPIDQFLWARMRFSASFNAERDEIGTGAGFRPGGYLTDYYTDESLRVIGANKHRPFFLYLAHWGVHTPLQATREDYAAVGDIQPHRLRVYAAMIRALDRSVGRILDKLEQEGLADNTLVVFTSDNGGAGYLGLPEVNSPFRGWKITSFEGGLRVPLFMRWPTKIPAGLRVQQPVAHIDVLPTLLQSARLPMPKGVQIDGKNLLPLTQATGGDDWYRPTLYWVADHSQVVRHEDWKLQLNTRPTDGLQKWLYNLAEDPHEKNNVAAAYPAKVRELEALLAAYLAEARPPLFQATMQNAVMVDKTREQKVQAGDEYVYSPN